MESSPSALRSQKERPSEKKTRIQAGIPITRTAPDNEMTNEYFHMLCTDTTNTNQNTCDLLSPKSFKYHYSPGLSMHLHLRAQINPANPKICLKLNVTLDVLAQGRLQILSLHTFQCKTEAQCWSKGGDWKLSRPHIMIYVMVSILSSNQTCRERTAGKRLKNCFKYTTALAVW